MKGKKGKAYYEAACVEHGKKPQNMPWKSPQVKVGLPLTKRERLDGGCAECNKKISD